MSGGVSNDSRQKAPFTESVLDLLERVEYRRVDTSDITDPVYRLRYEAYRREEFVPFNADGVVVDEFDELPNSHCYGVFIDGRLASSIRFHYLTPDCRTSPNYSVFGDILDPYLDRGDTILDPGRFSADHEASLAHPALPFLTLRIPTMAVIHFNVRYCLSSVRPEHSGFYRRIYRSVQWGEPRTYHGLTSPVVLYACEIPVMYTDMLRRYPIFRSTEEERERLFNPSGCGRARPSVRTAQRLFDQLSESV